MHPAIIIGTVRSLIVDVAMGQIPRSTERISSCILYYVSRVELRSVLIIIIITEWPKQQRHHEDHYSRNKYSRIRQCCNSSGISVSSNGTGRLTGTERR